MTLRWLEENPAYWDQDKARIIGGAPAGAFDARYQRCQPGALLPGTWWRAEDDGRPVGYGWLDVVWGDAEILLATEPEGQGRGVGTFVLEQLEAEARQRGLNYLYNVVRPAHPQRVEITAWLVRRGFHECQDGSLVRAVARKPAS